MADDASSQEKKKPLEEGPLGKELKSLMGKNKTSEVVKLNKQLGQLGTKATTKTELKEVVDPGEVAVKVEAFKEREAMSEDVDSRKEVKDFWKTIFLGNYVSVIKQGILKNMLISIGITGISLILI
jgi:hypothetical protein